MARPERAARPRESVWDYPRPPAVEPTGRVLRVVLAGETVAETRRGLRVLETSSPPTYYFPPGDVRLDLLEDAEGHTLCEWKGIASYFHVRVGDRVARRAAWTYRDPVDRYEALRDFIAFYPGRVDACYVDDEEVRAQDGAFYGGWITAEIDGPFKGAPGTEGW